MTLKTMKFESLKNWLMERAAERLEYGCIMLKGDVPNWKEKISIVKPEDLYVEGDDYGYEKEPHVTVIYGLHDEDIDRGELYDHLKNIWSIRVTINQISIFETDEYDVVKFDVPLVKDLKAYRQFFEKFYPNTQTYDEYHPHMTIAYVKKGEGKKYVQKIEPFKVLFNKSMYSYKDEKKIFDLGDEINPGAKYEQIS